MAEDDVLLSHFYKKVFETNGYEIEFAVDGEEAISKIKNMRIKPSIIILDILLPKKDGFEVIEEIKKDSELKDIPVIYFTNVDEENYRKKGLSLGAVAYLVKAQYVASEVVHKVKEICDKYCIK